MFLAVFIIVRSLAESFPALMSSTSPLDSDAAYSQRAFLFPNGLNSSYNTITSKLHRAEAAVFAQMSSFVGTLRIRKARHIYPEALLRGTFKGLHRAVRCFIFGLIR